MLLIFRFSPQGRHGIHGNTCYLLYTETPYTLSIDTLSSSYKFETSIFENVGCRVLQVKIHLTYSFSQNQ